MAYLGEAIKKLGFGLMRLPQTEGEIDIEQTKQMVDMFLEKGFTYFDTAYGYGNGKSEAAIKLALVDRYPRDKFLLATKLPAWAGAKNAEEAREMFSVSLKRTGAGYFDFYLLHNLGAERTQYFEDFGIWDFVQELKEKGLVKHMGFSFHDTAEKLDAILTAHPEAEFVQLQINYADWESPVVQSKACYEVAQKHGKPVIIMEPVKGGYLSTLPEGAADVLKKANPDVSLPSWAIRFAASLPGVITVLSGMSNVEQMQDNLKTMSDFAPLSDAERKTIADAVSVLKSIPTVPCTGCSYCTKGCPRQIAIPGVFSAMNNRILYGNEQAAKGNYMWETHVGGKASECIECGQCESVCPQHIDIIERLKTAVKWFE